MSAAWILNHVWQSTAFAAVMAVVAWGLRRQQARVRFGIWLAASVKFLLPFGALVAVGRWLPWPLPWTNAAAVAQSSTVAALQPLARTVSAPFGAEAVTLWDAGHTASGQHLALAWLIGIWAAGAALLLARWVWRWHRLARIARRGERREMAGVPVVICNQAQAALEPGVFGIVHPVVLLPRGFEARLSPDELAAVLAHERAHMRRRDNLWAALHGVVECLFWFHPGIWWLGSQLVNERERACDEAVLEAGGDPEVYASSILCACRYYVELPAAVAAGVSGGGLRQRVAGILHGDWGARLGAGHKAMLWSLGTAAVALPLAAGLLFGQGAGPKAFTAASVRVAKVPPEGIPIRFSTDPQRLAIENMSLADILMRAYDLQPYQIKAPAWMKADHIDVQAATATPATTAQMKVLLQPLMVERFGIKMHWATVTADMDRLTVAPGGLKIKKSASTTPKNIWLTIPDNGTLRFTGSLDMAGLATMVALQLGRPVVDATGLRGDYDVDISFKGSLGMGPRLMPPGVGNFMISARGPGRGMRGAPASPAPEASPSLQSALAEQLGLRLVAGKGPVKSLVIDSANPMPREN